MTPLMTRQDVADHLQVAPRTVDRIRKSDDTFPTPIRVGRSPRWSPSAIARWSQTPIEESPSRGKSAEELLA